MFPFVENSSVILRRLRRGIGHLGKMRLKTRHQAFVQVIYDRLTLMGLSCETVKKCLGFSAKGLPLVTILLPCISTCETLREGATLHPCRFGEDIRDFPDCAQHRDVSCTCEWQEISIGIIGNLFAVGVTVRNSHQKMIDFGSYNAI